MTRPDPDFEAWIARGKAATVTEAAAVIGWSPADKGNRVERHGACPVCGDGGKRHPDRFWINTSKNLWCCRKCGQGRTGGVSLVMFAEGRDFLEAVERLAGPRPTPRTGESEAEREARRRRWEAEAAEARAASDRAADEGRRADNAFRERERRDAYVLWRRGLDFAGSPAERYLMARGLDVPPEMRSRTRARWHPDWPLWDNDPEAEAKVAAAKARGEKLPRSPKIVVHRGPALLLPIVGADGRFMGLHSTWFDPVVEGEKIFVVDAGGERVPAKKIRGLKKGGHIVLVEPEGPMVRLFTGEGAETVLSPWTALRRQGSRLLDGAGFRTSVDLGNLGGKALDRIEHPTETSTDKRGRVRRVTVPGIVPDLSSVAMTLPETVVDAFYIGDGDSERFRTRCTLVRAVVRNERPGRTQRIVMAPDGTDFNDRLRGRG